MSAETRSSPVRDDKLDSGLTVGRNLRRGGSKFSLLSGESGDVMPVATAEGIRRRWAMSREVRR